MQCIRRLTQVFGRGYPAASELPLRRWVMNDDVTRLLQCWSEGDTAALERVLPQVYAELRRLARIQLSRQSGHETLQPTALVNDVLLKMIDRPAPVSVDSRAHLYNMAARMMRQLLVDRARSAGAEKHGGGWLRDDFAQALDLPIPEHTRLPELDAALETLTKLAPRMAQIVEMRFFIGLSVTEVASILNLDDRTVYRDWAAARAWLRDHLSE